MCWRSPPPGNALDEAELPRPANDLRIVEAEHPVKRARGRRERTELARLGSKPITLAAAVVRLGSLGIGGRAVTHEPRLVVPAEEKLDEQRIVPSLGGRDPTRALLV